MSVDFSGSDDCSCRIAQDDRADSLIRGYRDQGLGYKKIHTILCSQGFPYSRFEVQQHCQCVPRTVLTAIGDIEDQSVEVPADYFASRGIDLPEGYKFVAATVTDVGANGLPVWVRVKPETEEIEERVEIRQAQPILLPERPRLTVYVPGKWLTWAVVPDGQQGYWIDSNGLYHTCHDEQAFSVGHQIMAAVAESDGLHGILDCGDYLDLSLGSRWSPTTIDLSVTALNATLQRASEELAKRRALVGPEGEVVVLAGNHDQRIQKTLDKHVPWLVGLRRPGEENDEWPVMSVPFLLRAKDYSVEWCESFPGSYRKFNSNIVAMHSPALGTKPFDTARRIATMIHASVVHGHSHRSERASFNLETTDKGVRTFSVFSSGCWARIDGSLPSGKNVFDSYGNRVLASNQPPNTGMLSENFHQGMDILHVEQGGKERWSAEHVEFWGGWAMFRGQQFEADCDLDGNLLVEEAAA